MTYSAENKRGMALIAASVAFFVLVFVLKGLVDRGPHPEADGCLPHVGRSTVVLLDYSDSLSKQTRDEIESRTTSWVLDSVTQGERVSVFVANAESLDSLEPAFSRCKPAQNDGGWVRNASKVRTTFDSSFRRPLKDLLLVPATASRKSPIAQAIIDLSLSKYMRADTTTLLVFSDLLEHNPPSFSLYNCTDEKQVIARFRSARFGMQQRPVFVNTRALLNIVPRSGLSPRVVACRDKLWLWFFGDNRGPLARVEPSFLPGGPTPTRAMISK